MADYIHVDNYIEAWRKLHDPTTSDEEKTVYKARFQRAWDSMNDHQRQTANQFIDNEKKNKKPDQT